MAKLFLGIESSCDDTAAAVVSDARAILSSVYSATVLYWLGDESAGHGATWSFLDRRIADVMQFEKTLQGFFALPKMRIVLQMR